MIFSFLKYIKPIWYFNLPVNRGKSVFPHPDFFPENVKASVSFDHNYRTKEAILSDASWQAYQKGYIGKYPSLKIDTEISVVDEYRFIRKYHKPIWVWYCLALRLLSFNNPLKEWKAWRQTKHVKKLELFENPIENGDWNTFKSQLLEKKPKISVIIPTLNRYAYLKNVLHDLEAQDYPEFEVIIVDQSEPFREEFYKNFKLDLHVIRQEEKALWLARNTAIMTSDAANLLLFDDDSRVHADWISNHLKGLDFFDAAISSGQSIANEADQLPVNYRYFRISDLLDTGNVLIKREVFKSIGLFDRQFEKQRMGDAEFGLRAYLNGYLNISNPHATRLHLKVRTGGLRQMGSWDAFRSNKIFAPKPIPSVLYLYRKYFGNKLTLLEMMKALPLSSIPYRFKRNKKLRILGAVLSIIIVPITIFQVISSWRSATIKLNQGALIDELK